MSCRIYLVRHAETEWNSLKKFQGHTDVPLSEKGREQASFLAERLSNSKINGIYTSDLTRAYETAEIVASYHGLSINALAGLRELNFGAWEGMTSSEIVKAYQDEIKLFWENPMKALIPNGETLCNMIDRNMAAIKDIVNKHGQENVVVVSHGGSIRSIVASVLGMDFNKYWRLRLDNASLSIIEFPIWEKGILMLFNDCSHLQ